MKKYSGTAGHETRLETFSVMSVVSEVNLMESPPDKVVLVGDVGVGKTSLFMRFATGQFVEDTTAMHNPKEARLSEFHKEWTIDGEVVSVSFNCA